MLKLDVMQIRSALLQKGFTVSQWSKKNGFSQKTVSRVLHTWLNRREECPRGLITRNILSKLSRELGIQLNPL